MSKKNKVRSAEVAPLLHRSATAPRRRRSARIESATDLVPLWVAESVLNEAEAWLRTTLPAEWPAALAAKAERCFAGHRQFHRLISAHVSGIANLRKFMRHWLSGRLLRAHPALYRRLPESFTLGLALPRLSPPHGPSPWILAKRCPKSEKRAFTE